MVGDAFLLPSTKSAHTLSSLQGPALSTELTLKPQGESSSSPFPPHRDAGGKEDLTPQVVMALQPDISDLFSSLFDISDEIGKVENLNRNDK